ncbi:MAG TPA: hypothetical protein VGL66_18745 [Caulobacteraceae bacterium]|jgi:hypothetical protein
MTRFLSISLCALALAAAPLAAAYAQASATASPTAVKPFAVTGTIVRVQGHKIWFKDDKGQEGTAMIAKDALIIQIAKISIGDIKPGSFVATANKPEGDNAGTSTELRVFGGELARKRMGEGSYPMDDGQNMTNGTVNTMVKSAKGRELEVAYNGKGGKGARHITVPADMTIRSMATVKPSALKAGAAARFRMTVGADGRLVADRIIIGEHGKPPMM